MADEDTEVKAGSSKAGHIAIATALIGAITTISVAYINKGDSTPAPPPEPIVASSSGGEGGEPSSSGGDAPVQTSSGSIEPQPLMETNSNIGGTWRAADGEELQIVQRGASLILSTAAITEAGPTMLEGAGNVKGRDLSWTMQLSAQGGMIESDCAGKVTKSGRTIQGTCEILGQQLPFLYNRTQ